MRSKFSSRLKVNFVLLCFAICIITLVAACSSDSGGSVSSNDDDAKDQTFNFSYASTFPPPMFDFEGSYFAIEEFAEEIEKRTDGNVTFDIFHSNSLVPQNELLDALAAGTVDFGFASPGFYTDLNPTASFATLPFWSPSDEFSLHIFNETEIGEMLNESMENLGAKILMWAASSESGFISNTPIRTYEDFSGLIIRSGGVLWNEWYEKMGAAPANISVIESYEAMQRGTINAQGAPYLTIEAFNFHEVADYMIQPPVLASNYAITLVSLEAWESLPTEYQDIIMEVAREMEAKAAEGAKVINDGIEDMADRLGIEIITLPDEEIAKWEESGRAAWESFANMNDKHAKMIEILEEELEKAGY